MPIHKCPKCKKVFKQKGHLKDHLNKKNTCQEEIEILHPKPMILHTNPMILHANPNILDDAPEIVSMLTTTDIILHANSEIAPIPVKSDIKCNYCHKTFTRQENANRHMKELCKVMKQQNKDKQEIFEKLELIEFKNKQLEDELKKRNKQLEDELKEREKLLANKDKQYEKQLKIRDKQFKEEMKILREEIKNIQHTPTNVNSNNSINNGVINNTNIIMVTYGQEDMSKICDKDFIDACKRGYNSVPQLVESIHFNPAYPEYHNVYIPDTKNKHAMVYDNDKWVLRNKDDVVSEMYDTKKDLIINNMENTKKSLNDSQQKTLQRWLTSDENKDNNDKDKDSIEYVYESLKLLLYNLKNIPIETKNKLQKEGKQQLIKN